jgi:hypothetical protein
LLLQRTSAQIDGLHVTPGVAQHPGLHPVRQKQQLAIALYLR